MSEESIRIIEYSEIGKVSFVKKSSVRNLKITIKPFKGVQVTVPRFLSFESADRFVKEKKTWIRQSQLKLTRYEKGLTLFEEPTSFRTRDHILVLGRHAKATIRTVIGQGKISVTFPDFAEVKDPRIQSAIRKAILQTWRIEARKYLPDRVQNLASQHNLHFSKISVRDNKTRWGSCSKDNSINLNIHLMRLPVHLCDYVILHELAHTLYKHHQKTFWQFLDKLTRGNARNF